jgi:hypothetical protein
MRPPCTLRPHDARRGVVALLAFVLLAPLAPSGSADAGTPTLTPIWESSTTSNGFHSLTTFEEGLEFEHFDPTDADQTGLWRLDTDGLHRLSPYTGGPTTRTAEGELVHPGPNGPRFALLLETADGPIPLVHARRLAGFGPDGAFYSWGSTSHLFLERLTEARETSTVFTHPGHSLDEVGGSWMPDGRLLVHVVGLPLFLDVTTGFVEPAPDVYQGIRAFDTEGRGYRPINGTQIERVDPTTGDRTIVATSDRLVREIALAGERLYAVLGEGPAVPGMPPSRSALANAPLDGVGFGGFHPSFAPTPLPDLVALLMEDENLGPSIAAGEATVSEEHVLRIQLGNVGAGDAGASRLDVRQIPRLLSGVISGCRQTWSIPIDPLASGETVLVEIPWRAQGASFACAGDQTFLAEADAASPLDSVVEADETNNVAFTESHVLVGGDRAACRGAMNALLGEESLVAGLRAEAICTALLG